MKKIPLGNVTADCAVNSRRRETIPQNAWPIPGGGKPRRRLQGHFPPQVSHPARCAPPSRRRDTTARHCEGVARSNPERPILDCFAPLAMTDTQNVKR